MTRQPRIPVQRRAIDTRNRILDAADALITTLVLTGPGLGGLSMADVIRDSGVSPGTFYDYFPDPAALIDALLDRYIEALTEITTSALVDGEDDTCAADITDRLLFAVTDFYESNPGHRALWRGSALQGERKAAERASDKLLIEGLVEVMAAKNMICGDMHTVRQQLNLTWRIGEALLAEAFDLSADAGNPVGPPDPEAFASTRAIMRARMTSPALFNPPAGSGSASG